MKQRVNLQSYPQKLWVTSAEFQTSMIKKSSHSRKRVSCLVLTGIIILNSFISKSRSNEVADFHSLGQKQEAAEYLFFRLIPDGKCQTLSDGGKLTILVNRHTSKAITFRLVRFFAGKRQGLSKGTIYPDAGDYKLGCSIIDNRHQAWGIERAVFLTN